VSLNPVIKFTTLFGLLAVEIAVTMKNPNIKTMIGVLFFTIALVFVYRSFYSMRIPEDSGTEDRVVIPPAEARPGARAA
jgi:K(+)-stimulated pyrophosphate-energized sodium pump